MTSKKKINNNYISKQKQIFLILFSIILILFVIPKKLESVSLEKADSIANSIRTNNTINDSNNVSKNENLTDKKKNPYSFLLNSSENKNNNKLKQQNWGLLVFKLIVVLIFLVILIYLFIFFLKKVQSKKMFNSNLPTELYSILGNAPITFNKNFVIIKFYDKIYLLSVADNNVSVIDKITDIEKISNIEQIIPRNDSVNLAKSAFSKLLNKNLKKLDKE